MKYTDRTQHPHNQPETQQIHNIDQSVPMSGEAAPHDGLSSLQHTAIRLQRLVGNATTQQLLRDHIVQRQDEPAAADVAVRDWPKVLEIVNRNKEQRITKIKDENKLNIPEMPALTMTPEKQTIVDQIKANRANLPPALEKLAMSSYKGDKQAGYMYGGGGSAKTDTYAGMDEKRKQVMQAIHQEIGREGGWSAVNTYDDAVVTLGRGFTRTLLAKVMQTFFANDPEAKNIFLDLGITWQNNKALVVNTETGGIEQEDNALRLIQLEPAILSVFVRLAESAEHGQKLAAAQESQTLGYQVPQSVIDTWTDMMAVRLVAHLTQWRSGKLWPAYAGCNGYASEIMQVAKSVINKNKTDSAKGGAHIITAEQTGILFSFANGKAKEALDAPDPVELPQDIAPDSMKNVILLDSGDGKKFYRMSPVRIGTTVIEASYPPLPGD